ncbi:MAG: hypothetical protein HUJ30_02970 [Gammaproteobacteria bacterium]|nr:hypothetical protein [Gammaproteobacteria bacterium]
MMNLNTAIKPLAIMGVLILTLSGCQRDYYIKPAENVIPVHQPGDTRLSCEQLDRQIGRLQRAATSMVPPDFLNDSSNDAAMFAGSFVFTPAYLYLLKNEWVDKPKQYERINAMVKRIELLQTYKAEKHCFERR